MCRECNEFYCARCLPEDSWRVLCLRCNTPRAVREAPERLRGLFRDLWISPLVMGFGVLVGSVALALSGLGTPAAMGIILGPIASLPFFVVSLLVAAARSVAAAWIGFGFELLLMLLLLRILLTRMAVAAPALPILEMLLTLLFPTVVVLAAALVPIMTLFQIHKVRELQALLRQHSQARAAP